MHGADTIDNHIDAFLARLRTDLDWQEQLGPIVQTDLFADACERLSAVAGLALSREALEQRLWPDPLGISQWSRAAGEVEMLPVEGWLPANSVPTAGAPVLQWAWFGGAPLRESFYFESARRAAARPLSRLLRPRTSLQILLADANSVDRVPPTGFIFHMSRCGSTLAAQMLAAPEHHLVLSEPEPLDAVIQWLARSALSVDDQVAALRAVVGALGRNRSGDARRLFIKFDSWHTLALPLIRAAFPEVPWIFLYRDPVEVLVSQIRQRGVQTVPGALPWQVVGGSAAEDVPAEAYIAQVLGRICDATIEHWHLGGGMLVNYAQLPAAMERLVPRHFGFTPDATELDAMRAASEVDAKSPHERFQPDSRAKQAEASPAARAAAQAHMDGRLARLEALRTA